MESVERKVAGLCLALLLALTFYALLTAAADDCNTVMAALASAQREAHDQMDVVDALEAAMGSPAWDPVQDGWMVGAHAGAVDDLVGYLNAASLAEEAAHAAHCYLNTAAGGQP